MNTTPHTPNYPLRRAVALTLFCLFIYFVGLPVFEFVMHTLGHGILALHEVLVTIGWVEPLP